MMPDRLVAEGPAKDDQGGKMDLPNPLKLLEAARRAVPAVKYALGVAGVAIAAAIVISAVGNGRAAIIIMGGTLVAMVLLFVFSQLVAVKSPSVNIAGIAMLWSVVFFFTAFMFFTISAFAFQWPRTWATFIGVPIDEPNGVFAAGESAAGKRRQKELANWFCKVLHSKFDINTAVASFPFGKLPAPVHNERTDDGHLYESFVSENLEYRVEYSYATEKRNPSHLYGFVLLVEELRSADTAILDTQEKRTKWLSQFGKVTSAILGHQVGTGKIGMGIDDPAFKFATWTSRDGVQAEWFSAGDIILAKKLCGALR
jgi:hypothetical protein